MTYPKSELGDSESKESESFVYKLYVPLKFRKFVVSPTKIRFYLPQATGQLHVLIAWPLTFIMHNQHTSM